VALFALRRPDVYLTRLAADDGLLLVDLDDVAILARSDPAIGGACDGVAGILGGQSKWVEGVVAEAMRRRTGVRSFFFFRLVQDGRLLGLVRTIGILAWVARISLDGNQTAGYAPLYSPSTKSRSGQWTRPGKLS
jgi:hypothetical protein